MQSMAIIKKKKAYTNMPKQEVNMRGTCKWAKVQQAADNYDKTGKEYSIDLYPDEASMKAFKASGLQLKVREDEDGEFIKFRRPVSKMIKDELVELGAPKIIDEQNEDLDCLVGNGSEVTIKVTVYDTRMGKGHQFEGMKVHSLVEYEGELDPIGADAPF